MRLLSDIGRVVFSLCLAGAIGACGGNEDPPSTDNSGGAGNGDGDSTQRVACEEDSECSDGNACNGVETCEDGFCAPGEEVDCNDRIDCTRDLCDPVDGTCFNTPPDNDGDGHTAANCVDADGAPLGDDCDDNDSNRFPGNTEMCSEIDPDHDEDCDPQTFGNRDLDGDGYTDHLCRNVTDSGNVFAGLDCDDQVRTINPDNAEVCDGFDNNCDGEIDEDLTIKGFRDKDGDGIGVPVTTGELEPGDIVDGDGRLEVCPGTAAVVDKDVDCDDTNALINEEMFELCDGVDNDCNGEIDDNIVQATWYIDKDGDGFGNPAGPIQISCTVLVGYSLYPTDCDDTNPLSNPNQKEICDGQDNDCDGEADFSVGPGDFEDDDGDGSPDPACGTPAPDCNDNDPTVRPGATELCDGLDNDCNGVADTQVQTVFWYLDADGDGWGNPLVPPIDSCDAVEGRVTKVGDCDDGDPNRNPDQADDCTGIPGFDDNCDGQVDENEVAQAYFRDFDNDGFGELDSEPLFACQAPAGWAPVSGDCEDTNEDISPLNSEVCTPGDGFDDDCDGFVDCADSDCSADLDCLGLFEIELVAPTAPIAALIATPLQVTVSVQNSVGDPQVGFDLDIACEDGAVTTTPSVSTDASGEANLTLYPGIGPGIYECYVADAMDFAVPLRIEIQGIGPTPGTIQTVFNLAGTNGEPIAGPSLTSPMWVPHAIEVGADGTAYVLDQFDDEIWVVTPRGVVTPLFASQGLNGSSILGVPYDLAMDRTNNVLYITSSQASGGIFEYNLNNNGLIQIAGGDSDTYVEGMNAIDFNMGNPYALHFREGVGVAFVDHLERMGLVRPDGTLYLWPKGSAACNSGTTTPTITDCNANGCGVALTETGALLQLGTWCEIGNTSNGSRLARLANANATRQILTSSLGGGNGVPLSLLTVGAPRALNFDNDDNLIVVDDHRVRWVHRTEQVAIDLAGTGVQGFSGDYGPGTSALLDTPQDAAVGPDGSVWIVTETDNRVRRIWRPTPTSSVSSVNVTLESADPMSTVAYPTGPVQVKVEDQDNNALQGIPVIYSGTANSRGDEGPAVTAANGVASQPLLGSMTAGNYPYTAFAEDLHGAVLGTVNFTLSVSEPPDGTISTVTNLSFLNGTVIENDWAASMRKGSTRSVEVRDDGTIYWADGGTIYAQYLDGSVARVAGGSSQDPNNVSALSAQIGSVHSMIIDDPNDRMYIASGDNEILVYELDGGIIWRIDFTNSFVYTVAVSPDGTEVVWAVRDGLWHADMTVFPPTVTNILPTDLNVNTNCAGFPGKPYFNDEEGLAWGSDGLVYIMGSVCANDGTRSDGLMTFDPDVANSWVHVANISHTVARNMQFGPDGNLYFANDDQDSVIRWTGSTFELVAGSGAAGNAGDLGPATAAQLNAPQSIAFTPEGDVVIADWSNFSVRKVWLPPVTP